MRDVFGVDAAYLKPLSSTDFGFLSFACIKGVINSQFFVNDLQESFLAP